MPRLGPGTPRASSSVSTSVNDARPARAAATWELKGSVEAAPEVPQAPPEPHVDLLGAADSVGDKLKRERLAQRLVDGEKVWALLRAAYLAGAERADGEAGTAVAAGAAVAFSTAEAAEGGGAEACDAQMLEASVCVREKLLALRAKTSSAGQALQKPCYGISAGLVTATPASIAQAASIPFFFPDKSAGCLPSEEHPQKEREVGSPSTAGVDALDEEKQNETENDHENGEDDLGATLPTREGMPPLAPMRAVAYGALPCAMPHAQHYAPEMMSCNLVGLPSEDRSHSRGGGLEGLDGKGSHQGFLNRAQKLKLNVMPGFHSTEPAMCDHFDCHDAWKAATLKGFKQGFLVDNRWHPAISTVILMNEPDFYDNDALCTDRGAWCRVKAVLSAMDGLLQAEEEAQVLPSDVKLTVTWSLGGRYKLWNDTEVEQFVAETSADLIWPLWQGLKPVERADVFRYLVVYEQGGYYADAWLPETQMIVGYQGGYRMPGTKPTSPLQRVEQFEQWFFASAPRNPVLRRS
eukprot:g24445.t1